MVSINALHIRYFWFHTHLIEMRKKVIFFKIELNDLFPKKTQKFKKKCVHVINLGTFIPAKGVPQFLRVPILSKIRFRIEKLPACLGIDCPIRFRILAQIQIL